MKPSKFTPARELRREKSGLPGKVFMLIRCWRQCKQTAVLGRLAKHNRTFFNRPIAALPRRGQSQF